LTFQCRNFVTAKEEAEAAAVAALERERGGAKGKDLAGTRVATDATNSEKETEISDNDEYSEIERALARLGRSKKKESSKEKASDKERSEEMKSSSSRQTKTKSNSRRDFSPDESD
jgi:hypothetical protein